MNEIDDLKSKLQLALTLTDIDKRIEALGSCLDLCDELQDKELKSCLSYYSQYQEQKKLVAIRTDIENCLIDAKLKPLW
jgi:hypothetical protein